MAGNLDLLSKLYPQGPVNLTAPRLDLQAGLGLGAAPSLGVGDLAPPDPSMAAPPAPVAPTLASQMPQRPAPAPAPRGAPQGPPGGELGQIQAGYALKEKAAQAAADAEVAKSNRIADLSQQGIDEYRKNIADDETARQQAAAMVSDRRKQLYQDLDELTNTKIDPNRIVHNASTLQNVLGAISIGVGGYLSSKYGGPNQAYQIIKDNIDRDTQAQVEDLNTKKAGIQAKTNLLGQLMTEGKDAAEARHLVTAAKLDMVMKAADVEAKRIGTPEAQANADKIKSQAMIDAGKDAFALKDKMQEKALEWTRVRNQKEQFLMTYGQNQMKEILEHAEKMGAQGLTKAAAEQKAMNEARERVIPGVKNADGTPFIAPLGKSESVDKFNHEQMPELLDGMRAMDENIELAKNFNRITDPFLRSAAAQKMESNRLLLAGLTKGIFGRVNEKELEIALKSAGDPTAWLSQMETMKAFRENMRVSVENKLKPFGYTGHFEPEASEAMKAVQYAAQAGAKKGDTIAPPALTPGQEYLKSKGYPSGTSSMIQFPSDEETAQRLKEQEEKAKRPVLEPWEQGILRVTPSGPGALRR